MTHIVNHTAQQASRPAKRVSKNTEVNYAELEKDRWENEGGTHLDCADTHTRIDSGSLGEIHRLISQSENQFADGQIGPAVSSLMEAAERFEDNRQNVYGAFDRAIARLSSTGCNASPPHPEALSLIKVRNKLPQ